MNTKPFVTIMLIIFLLVLAAIFVGAEFERVRLIDYDGPLNIRIK